MAQKKPGIALLLAFILALLLIIMPTSVHAESPPLTITSGYSTISISSPEKTTSIVINITTEMAASYRWKPSQRLSTKVFVELKGGSRHYIQDIYQQKSWSVHLNEKGQAKLTIQPSQENISGRLRAQVNGKDVELSQNQDSDTEGPTLEKVVEGSLRGGVFVKVHYTDQLLEEGGADALFPKEVLEAALMAYQTITEFHGFSSSGYSFSEPDKNYAYDPDKTIDIYLGNPSADNRHRFHGFTQKAFRDAPCFDTIKHGQTAYDSFILLPVNYSEFIKNWEKLNPSSLGKRNLSLDLRGTLIHEMLHVIIFYYNKNLERESSGNSQTQGPISANSHLDWYVEGLARYFETFAGARHDFYSQGFKEMLPDKIRFSRGGSNYYMRYPDQTFTELRYENALFWRFMDYQYGIGAIEKLSRRFRGSKPQQFRHNLESVTGVPFSKIMKKYAQAVLLKDFGLRDDAANLKEVAMTRLLLSGKDFILLDGFDNHKNLGPNCRTDWIGQWDDQRAVFGQAPMGGDNTETSDVSGWATDFYKISPDDKGGIIPEMSLTHEEGRGLLAVQVVLITRGGSTVSDFTMDVARGTEKRFSVESIIHEQGIDTKDIDSIYLLITNMDPENASIYELKTI